MKRTLPMLITLISGTVVLSDYFLRVPWLQDASNDFLAWSVLIASFATGLGGANILKIHSRNILTRSRSWGLSIVLVFSLITWFVVGITTGTNSPVYQFIWENVYGSLSATMFALNGFFIASAAYRSFRVRNMDSTFLLLSAVIVMMGRVGLGEMIYSKTPQIADWLMKVPGTAGMRGITIGSALGAITVSLRIILGLERGSTGFSE